MIYGMTDHMISYYVHTLMLIGQEVQMIERVPVMEISSWEEDWFLI